MLKRGSRGELVRELQEKLLSLGYELPQFGADGDFGSGDDIRGLINHYDSFFS